MKKLFPLFMITTLLVATNALHAGEDLPFAVGSSTFFIHDETRPFDRVAGVNSGVRSLLTEIWYPVDHEAIAGGEYARATYGDYSFGDKGVHRLMLTNTTFFHLTPDTVLLGVTPSQIEEAIEELFDRPRGSYVDAPVAKGGSFPVVVMTHGDAGSRYNMETACEYLAANGYVVIAPEHTGNTPFAFTAQDPELNAKLVDIKPLLNEDGTYGPVGNYGQTYTPLIQNREDPDALKKLDDALLERVNDLRAVLSELDSMNAAGRFANRLDLAEVGVMGRSFGGTTTLAALGLESRFAAGFSVVPLVLPDLRPSLPKEMLKPEGEESVILGQSGNSVLNTLIKPTFLLSGAEDALIIGVGASMADAFDGEKPSPDNPLPALRKSYEDTTQPVVWGLLNDSNHGSFGVSGPFWWPELKPSTQQRFFDSTQSFALVEAETAHKIQKQKALEFFDTFLRDSDAARAQLMKNQFAGEGLVQEIRNFQAQ